MTKVAHRHSLNISLIDHNRHAMRIGFEGSLDLDTPSYSSVCSAMSRLGKKENTQTESKVMKVQV